jgi:hypothetical protein
MASNRGSEFSSPFDDMLEENRKRLEELYGGPRTPAAPPPPTKPSPTGPSAADVRASEAVRFLNDRYGEGWRYEITDRQRDGDEVVVLCKLVVEDQGLTKSQFGRARIGGGEATEIKGSAAGIAFSMGPETPPRAASADPVEDAFRRAEEAALAKCAGLL